MKQAAIPILLTVGLLQMTGDLLKIDWLKGFGAATVASPAPKVFSAVRGLETFSTRFFRIPYGAEAQLLSLRERKTKPSRGGILAANPSAGILRMPTGSTTTRQ